MTYANGPGMNYTVVDGAAARIDLTNTNTTSFDYVQQAAAYNDFETHGGEDVAIYAIG
ncbi:UNVERIFIED_CONTAM: hypothetical protein GTU68_006277, partial [Idotea baltica]|nr:hypothetical protein [Idotea baltica]